MARVPHHCPTCNGLTYICDQLLNAANVLAYYGYPDIGISVYSTRNDVMAEVRAHHDRLDPHPPEPDDEPPGQAQGPA